MSGRRLAIQSGPATVIASGEVTTFAGHGLVFELVEGGVGGRVELVFRADPQVEDVAVQTEELPDGYRLICVNFDGADGRGSSQPVWIGTLGEDLLFFHFRVFVHGRTEDRTVHYSFYRVPASAVARRSE